MYSAAASCQVLRERLRGFAPDPKGPHSCTTILKQIPKGSKVANYRVLGVSILGIVIMVLGRYLMVEYLDPSG